MIFAHHCSSACCSASTCQQCWPRWGACWWGRTCWPMVRQHPSCNQLQPREQQLLWLACWTEEGPVVGMPWQEAALASSHSSSPFLKKEEDMLNVQQHLSCLVIFLILLKNILLADSTTLWAVNQLFSSSARVTSDKLFVKCSHVIKLNQKISFYYCCQSLFLNIDQCLLHRGAQCSENI